MERNEKAEQIPIWEKALLTLNEARIYTGIGVNRLRKLSDQPGCKFILWVGNRRMFKRKRLEEYLEKTYST